MRLTGCPCGHLTDDECIRHKPMNVHPCIAHGFACRNYTLPELRRDRVCRHCHRESA